MDLHAGEMQSKISRQGLRRKGENKEKIGEKGSKGRNTMMSYKENNYASFIFIYLSPKSTYLVPIQAKGKGLLICFKMVIGCIKLNSIATKLYQICYKATWIEIQ